MSKAKIRWIANAFFVIETENHKLFLDPWVTDNPGTTHSLEEVISWKPTHVLVSHGHPGHFGRGDSIAIANAAQVPYITNTEVIHYIIEKRDMVRTEYIGIECGSKIYFDGITIQMVPIVHPDEPPLNPQWADIPGVPNCAFIINVDGFTFFHAGDTVYSDVYEKYAAENDIDLAMLPLWGEAMIISKDFAIEQQTKILETLKPKHVMFHNRWNPETPGFKAFMEKNKDNKNIVSKIHTQLIDGEIVIEK